MRSMLIYLQATASFRATYLHTEILI